MKSLILDLGSVTGWAILEDGVLTASGSKELATENDLLEQQQTGKERLLDVRFGNLLTWLREQVNYGVTRIVFEDVQFKAFGSFQSIQLWASLRTAIWVISHDHPHIKVHAVPVTVLKLFACGPGKGAGKKIAKKVEMAASLASAEPQLYQFDGEQACEVKTSRMLDHNEVDAIWLGRFTQSVDHGENQFLVHYDRLRQKKAERKKRREEKRLAKLERARAIKEKAAQRILVERAKATGKCCGVFRKPGSETQAKCPKCQQTVPMPAELPVPG